MYPGPLEIFGLRLATWNVAFLVGVLAGYFVMRLSWRGAEVKPSALGLRYAFCVYLCAFGAQLFAYAFDSNTTLLPPDGNWIRYYFNVIAGPKTLFGSILFLPIAVAVSAPTSSAREYSRVLDRFTPALMTVLAVARAGCFLQGCCYGERSSWLGLRFPTGSLVHADHYYEGLIAMHEPSLPVLPTQLPSMAACALLAIWSFRQVRAGRELVFVRTLAAYSVFRFLIEFVRADPSRNHFWTFSTSQWIALSVLLLLPLVWRARAVPTGARN